MKQLAEACEEMQDAALQVNGNSQVMVHKDLKPENVFLSEPLAAHFPYYPVLKFGDYGSCRHTSQSNPDNPDNYIADFKTNGYLPPEQWADPDWQNLQNANPSQHGPWGPDPPGGRNPNIWRVLGHTNMWQCGQIMADLLTQLTGTRRDDYTNLAQREVDFTNRMNPTQSYPHVVELQQKIRDMRRFFPGLRPRAAALRAFADHGRIEAEQQRNRIVLQGAARRRALTWNERMAGKDVKPTRRLSRHNAGLRGMKADRYAVGLSIMGRMRSLQPIVFQDRGRAIW